VIVALSIALAIVTVTLAVVAVATHETLLQIRVMRPGSYAVRVSWFEW